MQQNLPKAREILQKCKLIAKGEWKVYFEAVMIEIRNGKFECAQKLVEESLLQYQSTGRLWSSLI